MNLLEHVVPIFRPVSAVFVFLLYLSAHNGEASATRKGRECCYDLHLGAPTPPAHLVGFLNQKSRLL